MEGLFEVEKFHSGNLTDADFEQARREGKLRELIEGLPLVQRVQGKNRIFDNMAGFLLDKLFSCPNCADVYYRTDGVPAALACINMLTTDGDTTDYEEDVSNGYTYMWNVTDACVRTASPNSLRRFIEDEIDPNSIWIDPNREAVHFKSWWIFLPTWCVSSNIRSIGIFFSSDGDNITSNYRYHGRLGRVRLKDANGDKVILTKNNNEVLRVSYQFTLVAV